MVVTRATVMLLCAAVNFYIAEEPVGLRLVPRGDCDYCCPMDEKRDISFLLSTRDNPKLADLLIPGDDSLLDRSHFNRDHPTVIYLHGFTEDTRGSSSMAIKEAYLVRGGWNVILVDWGSLCAAPFYVTAVRNSRKVGLYVAKLINFLDSRGISMSTIHVVGFSLGAEAAGFAGQELKGKLPRITGLDPAYPLFKLGGWSAHLSPDDAKFVDIIHTDGGIFGFPSPLGHVDFYPNSGKLIQPGCDALIRGRARNPRFQYIACSHQRAWRFYVESVVNDCAFVSSKCRSWNKYRMGGCKGRALGDVSYMGYAAKNMTSRGVFYLKTNQYPPFANNPACTKTYKIVGT